MTVRPLDLKWVGTMDDSKAACLGRYSAEWMVAAMATLLGQQMAETMAMMTERLMGATADYKTGAQSVDKLNLRMAVAKEKLKVVHSAEVMACSKAEKKAFC